MDKMLPWDLDKTLSRHGSNIKFYYASQFWSHDNPFCL